MTTRDPIISLSGTADLVTSVPALLGFIPERSIILLAFESSGMRIASTLRHDLDLAGRRCDRPTANMQSQLDHAVAICLSHGYESVTAVLVDDRHKSNSVVYQRIIGILRKALGVGCPLTSAIVVDQLREGRQWMITFSIQPSAIGDTGRVGDPHSSKIAVANAVVHGRRVFHSRSEMAELLRIREQPDCVRADCAVHAGGVAAVPDGGALLTAAVDVIAGFRMGLSCAQRAVLAAALDDFDIRDAMMALAATALRNQAEAAYLELVRTTGGSTRTAAATLLGHLNYLQGNGAMAGTCFDVALAGPRRGSLAELLDQALRAGMHPNELLDVVAHSYAVADSLGVSLPAQDLNQAC